MASARYRVLRRIGTLMAEEGAPCPWCPVSWDSRMNGAARPTPLAVRRKSTPRRDAFERQASRQAVLTNGSGGLERDEMALGRSEIVCTSAG